MAYKDPLIDFWNDIDAEDKAYYNKKEARKKELEDAELNIALENAQSFRIFAKAEELKAHALISIADSLSTLIYRFAQSSNPEVIQCDDLKELPSEDN